MGTMGTHMHITFVISTYRPDEVQSRNLTMLQSACAGRIVTRSSFKRTNDVSRAIGKRDYPDL
jgi:hypothetical protein